MQSVSVFLFVFISPIVANSQAVARPLHIGDTVPDIRFNKVWNYTSPKARLSDFKGKLVILDFWNTGCTSCIEAFPKMSSLQKEFGDRIQILLVNPYKTKYETETRIRMIIDKYKIRTGDPLALPIPLFDTLLTYYFPHRTVPHQVWIDTSGKIIAISAPKYVTAANIQLALQGRQLPIPLKNDFYDFDKEVPLLVNGNGGSEAGFIYRSLFTGYNGNVKMMVGYRKDSVGGRGYYIFNYPLYSMLTIAYSDIFSNLVSGNRVIYEMKDAGLYRNVRDTAGYFCYDLQVGRPGGVFDPASFLRQDLERVFGVRVFVEKRRCRVLVVSPTKQITRSFTKFARQESDLDASSIKKYLHHFPAQEAINLLEDYASLPLVLDTILAQPIDISFPEHADLHDMGTIIQALKDAGFAVEEAERELKVVVIKEI